MQPKRHHAELKEALRGGKGGLLYVDRMHWDLPVTLCKVEGCEVLSCPQLVNQEVCLWHGISVELSNHNNPCRSRCSHSALAPTQCNSARHSEIALSWLVTYLVPPTPWPLIVSVALVSRAHGLISTTWCVPGTQLGGSFRAWGRRLEALLRSGPHLCLLCWVNSGSRWGNSGSEQAVSHGKSSSGSLPGSSARWHASGTRRCHALILLMCRHICFLWVGPYCMAPAMSPL